MEKRVKSQHTASLLFAVTAVFWCSQYSYTPYVNPELAKMGMSAAFMGLVSSAYGLTQTLLRLPQGMAAYRIGRQKPFVLIGSLFTAISAAVMLLFYSPAGFFAGRALAGVSSASWVSFSVLYGSYYTFEEAPRRISQLNFANMLGRLVGFVLILLIVPMFGVKSAFIFSLLVGSTAFLMAFRLREAPRVRQTLCKKDLAKIARDPYLRVCSFLGILSQIISFGTYYTFTVNAAAALGAASADLSLLSIFMIIPNLLTNYAATMYLMKKISARWLVAAGFLVSCLYCILVPLARNMTALYACQVLAGISAALTFAILMGQCVRDIPQERRAVAMGMFQSLYGIGMTVGPLIVGMVIDASSLKTAYFAVAALAAVSTLLSYRMMDIRPPQTSQ